MKTRNHLTRITRIILSIVITFVLLFSATQPGMAGEVNTAAAQNDDGVRYGYNSGTGKLSFVGADPEAPIEVVGAQAAGLSDERRGLVMIAPYAEGFGLADPVNELSLVSSKEVEGGRSVLRYQQTYQGIPVMAGEIIVNADDQERLLSLSGEIAPELTLSTTPSITGEDARQTALGAVAKWYELDTNDLEATGPELWIYDSRLLEPDGRPASLVWRMDVTAQNAPVRELVLIDAQTGGIALHFNQVDTAWTNIPATSGALQTTTDRFVSTTGADGGDCSDSVNPCLTINYAISQTNAGDSIKIAGGTYTGSEASVVSVISKNLAISGGWDLLYTSQTEITKIDGEGQRRGVEIVASTVTLDRVWVVNGYFSGGGGGIFIARDQYSVTSSNVTIKNSTISGNIATSSGGGVYVMWSKLSLINSTVSGNHANGYSFRAGGGLYLYMDSNYRADNNAYIQNSTITNNSTGTGILGTGMYALGNGTAIIQNTIIAGNEDERDIFIEGSGERLQVISNGHNIFGQAPDCWYCLPTLGEDDQLWVDPRLLPLDTATGVNPLAYGSPAIDAGNADTCEATDQLGTSRPIDGDSNGVAVCDIGAYETNPPQPTAVDSIEIQNGNNQTAATYARYTVPLSVIVRKEGDPIAGAVVTFTAPSSGASGTFSDTGTRETIAISGMDGVATAAPLTANSDVGTINVTATVPNVAPVQFALENYSGQPTTITIQGGTPQVAIHNTVFALPLKVLVLDQYGQPLPQVNVTFTAPPTGASGIFSDLDTTIVILTDISGIATATITANTIDGSYLVEATAGTASPVQFQLQNYTATPTTISINSGNLQTVPVNQAFPNPLKAQVKDQFAIPMPNVIVTFAAPASGVSGIFPDSGINITQMVTDIDGIAAVSLAANGIEGNYIVSASVFGIASPVDFIMTNGAQRKWYVSTTGNNGNNCLFPATACVTIDAPTSKPGYINGDTIYVGIGVFSTNTITKDAAIRGGWNADFSVRTGYSTLDVNSRMYFQGVENTGVKLNASLDHFIVDGYELSMFYAKVTVTDVLVKNGTGINIRISEATFDRVSVHNNSQGIRIYVSQVTITDSAIYNNAGTGVFLADGETSIVNIKNTTISKNNDTGIVLDQPYTNDSRTLIINNVTIADNQTSNANHAGGIYAEDGHVYLSNTIIANNSAPRYPDCAKSAYTTKLIFVSNGNNILSDSFGCDITQAPGDLFNLSFFVAPVADYGGPTWSQAILKNGQATDAGNSASTGNGGNACEAADQRGISRPVDGNEDGTSQCDIGAFEVTGTGTIPAYIYLDRGTPQTIGPGANAYPDFQVIVLDSYGQGVMGATVAFTAPSSGASGFFSNSGTNTTTSITDSNGIATASHFITDMSPEGSFVVEATVGGVAIPVLFQIIKNLDIRTYTMNHNQDENALPGQKLCDETILNCTNGTDPDADVAQKYALDTYWFYVNHHRRNSIDNSDMAIVSSVHFGTDYQNAYWNGSQVVYGDGFVVDDVAAHELTHGVTQYASNLIYYYQSGALSESFSDLWGEFVDQTNGSGNDGATVKWLIGEDLPGGAIRSMSNPPAFNDPDTMLSVYYSKSLADNGGVHTNSGVNNKAVYLMVEGGTFNKKTITQLGEDKVAAIYYEVQTNLLVSGSDYADLYNALYQGCINLAGTQGITLADCQQVRNATEAVQMNVSLATFSPDADLCPAGMDYHPSLVLFKDDFEQGIANWDLGKFSGNGEWQWASGYATSGARMLWGRDDQTFTNSYAAMNTNVALPAGSQPFLHFRHAFGFEFFNHWYFGMFYFDGGVLEYSVDNGVTWRGVPSLFSAGRGYSGTVAPYWGNALGGKSAFVAVSHGYVSSRYNLTSLTGKSVRFRWRVGTDNSGHYLGWFLDDVQIYICAGTPSLPLLLSPTANALTTDYTPRLDWSDPKPAPHHYQVQVATDRLFTSQVIDQNDLTVSEFTPAADLAPNTIYYLRVRAFNAVDGTKGWTAVRAFRTALLPPTLQAPPDGENLLNNRPIFYWGDVTVATGYSIQIAKNNLFTLMIGTYNVTSSTYTPIADLPVNTTLYWRVQSKGTNGPSAWSAMRSVNTANPPSIPTLLLPASKSLTTDYTPRFVWGTSTTPARTTFDHYELWLDDHAAFTSPYQADIAGVANHEYTIPDPNALNPNTTYSWRVRAYNSDGEYSSWSLVHTLRTVILPPVLQLPVDTITVPTIRPTFDWGDVSGASGYTIQISKDNIFTMNVVSATITSGKNSQYTPLVNLPINTLLYWRVKANGLNGPSLWSSPTWSFRTPNPPGVPSLTAPAINSLQTDYSPTLKWSKPINPTTPGSSPFDHYQVQIATDAAFMAIVQDEDVITYDTPEYTASPDLNPNTKYYCRVRAWNTLGHYSIWSAARYFRTALSAPVLSTPTDGETTPLLRPTFDWADVPGATSYTIQVSRNSTFTSLVVNKTVVASTYTPTINLPANIPLYWRVRANGLNGPSSWSAPIWSFTVVP
jgi:Zn-dependent metalloprotease